MIASMASSRCSLRLLESPLPRASAFPSFVHYMFLLQTPIPKKEVWQCRCRMGCCRWSHDRHCRFLVEHKRMPESYVVPMCVRVSTHWLFGESLEWAYFWVSGAGAEAPINAADRTGIMKSSLSILWLALEISRPDTGSSFFPQHHHFQPPTSLHHAVLGLQLGDRRRSEAEGSWSG